MGKGELFCWLIHGFFSNSLSSEVLQRKTKGNIEIVMNRRESKRERDRDTEDNTS